MNLIFKKAEKPLTDSLIDDIHHTLREMDAAYSRFELTVDSDLVDAAIYEINSLSAKYRYLLRLAKEKYG
ncbi:MAG: YaaL family protein [Clostridiales bacterium]|nr:YaaL family protein [Clostridiales bacterium]